MRPRIWIWFVLYCLFSASGWLLPPISAFVRCVVFAVVGVAAVAINGAKPWNQLRDGLSLGVLSLLLLGVPELLGVWAQPNMSSLLGTATLALIPMMLVLIVAQGSSEGATPPLLLPAAVGLGGLLLLIPVDTPRSPIEWVAFILLGLSAAMIAVSSVFMHRRLLRFSGAQAIAIFCLSNAPVLAGIALLEQPLPWTPSSGGLASCGEAAAAVVLFVVLLREMDPVRFAARYLVVPLLAIVEGYVFLRPDLTLRTWMGVGLLAGGAGFLLFPRRSAEVPSLRLSE